MNKAQFYKLFKPAFEKAFSEKNILSALHKAEAFRSAQEDRPLSKDSGSQSSISLSDWRKINRVVKDAVGNVLGYEGRRLLDLCYKLHAENVLLKAEIEGLKEAVRIEKKQKKPKKALFTELRGQEGNAAIFFSPAKILAAHELHAQKAREEEEALAKKEQNKIERYQCKEEKAELKRAAAIARQEKHEQLAAEKTQKKMQKEEAQQQRLINAQLSNEQKVVAKDQRKKLRNPQHQASSGGGDLEVVEERVTSEVFEKDKDKSTTDTLPATYHYHEAAGKRVVGDPAEDRPAFLRRELSLGSLADMLRHLWFAGAKRPAMPLHSHIAIGREIVVVDRMDLHLLWTNEGRLFVKPVPRFLLDPAFCRINLQCPNACPCDTPADTCRTNPRKVALGFLYTYACLISSESDFHVANEKLLLPCKENDKPIKWTDWKTLARELLRMHEHDPNMMHPRFLRAELRLSRINIIHRFTHLPRFDPYLRSRHNYGSLFGDNLAWMAAATVFVALVLTAMQVGLATERLKDDAAFQQASYGFTVFAIVGPMCAFGLVVLDALFHLVKDLPLLLGRQRTRREPHHTMSSTNLEDAA